MKKTTILGSAALLAVVTALFAAPALSTPSSKEATVPGLARQVAALRKEVKALRRTVRLTDAALFRKADGAEQRAIGAINQVQRLDGCLNRAVPVTRYDDFVGSDAATLFTDYDPDVLGYVPNIVLGSFNFTYSLDVTNPGSQVSYYLAIVEPSCAGGFFGMTERTAGVER
jgi:hypothetical protein